MFSVRQLTAAASHGGPRSPGGHVRRSIPITALGVLLVAAACSEPVGPSRAPAVPRLAVAPTPHDLEQAINALFPNKGALRTGAHKPFNALYRIVQGGGAGTPQAQDAVLTEVDYLLDQYQLGTLADPNGGSAPTTEELVTDLIDALYVY